jgi:hypothetical protein
MGWMNIFKVLLTGWLPLSDVAKGGVDLESMPGYGGVKFGKGFTDKELRVLAVLKK